MSISENAAQYLSEIFERYTKEFFTSIVNAEQNTLYFGYVGKNNYDVIKVISRSGAFESANRYEDAIVDGERSKVLRSLGMMPTEAITPVPVSEIISMFGAYDTDPQIGALSFSYFTQYLRENMDHPEAREIYKFVVENRQKFVSYENTRMQHKASLLPNIFPDIQEDTMKALVGWQLPE